MKADLTIKGFWLGSGGRLLLEVIDSWEWLSWEEQLHIAQTARETVRAARKERNKNRD